MTYVTSDTHFNHSNIIKYCRRPFADVDQQNRKLIKLWNAVVSKTDTIIHCGDFILGDPETIPFFLRMLNGHIILLKGNHDTPRRLAQYAKYPSKITVKDIHCETYLDSTFVFSHYPKSLGEFICCFGHAHDKLPFHIPKSRQFNVSCELTNYAPIALSDIYNIERRHNGIL